MQVSGCRRFGSYDVERFANLPGKRGASRYSYGIDRLRKLLIMRTVSALSCGVEKSSNLHGGRRSPAQLYGVERLRKLISMRTGASQSQAEKTVVKIPVKQLTSEAFRPFGQVIAAQPDGKEFDSEDAQLQLQNGTPRYCNFPNLAL